MEDVYKNCPIYEDKDYTLRLVRLEDKVDLLKVYSDEKAIPFLMVIIVAVTIFIIQLKIEWNRQLNIGFGSTADKDLYVGQSFQKQHMKQSER